MITPEEEWYCGWCESCYYYMLEQEHYRNIEEEGYE